MKTSTEIFEDAIEWLKHNYGLFSFFTERDVVWTIQTHITEDINKQNLPYRIFHNFPILPGKRQSLCTDLAILNSDNIVEIAAEFKYEPDHNRNDIWPTKFPVVFWGSDGVGKDIERIHDFVSSGKAKNAFMYLIDEGSYFRWREPYESSSWIDLDLRTSSKYKVSVLRAKI
jgi:hypothetical protein